MKKTRTLILASVAVVAFVSVTFFSCEKETIMPTATTEDSIRTTDASKAANNPCSAVAKREIVDQEGNAVGTAFVYNDRDYFYLKLVGKHGYKIRTAHLHVAADMSEIPLDEHGNPNFFYFDYAVKNPVLNPKIEFQVPIDKLVAISLITSTLEVVKTNGTEEDKVMRVWVDGKAYGASMYGRVFKYEKASCDHNDPGIVLTDDPVADYLNE